MIRGGMGVMGDGERNGWESVVGEIGRGKYYEEVGVEREVDMFEGEGMDVSGWRVSKWMMGGGEGVEGMYNEVGEVVKERY